MLNGRAQLPWIRIPVLVLTSIWLFPVSCTGALMAGTQVAAKLDERIAAKGESVHARFSVVAETGRIGEPFTTYELDELPALKEYSFLMSQDSGSFETNRSSFSFRVLEDTGSAQTIELVEAYHDGDNTIWSRYEATESAITPISSRMFYFGYMFTAFPYALGFAVLLPLVGWLIRKKQPPKVVVG